MSWEAYIQQLTASPHVIQAAIFGADDGGKWASSAGFEPSQQEVVTLGQGFKNPSSFAASGIRVGGKKYMFLRGDEASIVAKNKDIGGIAIARSNKAVLIATSKNETADLNNANTAVQKMKDYLVSNGY